MKATLLLRVEDDHVVDLRVEPPLGAKVIRAGGRLELHLVATAAGLLEGDELSIFVAVSGRSNVAVASAGATLVHPCVHGRPTRLRVEARVGPGAALEWAPEPLILTAGARHESSSLVTVGNGARVRWVEELVLGRSGEPTASIHASTELLMDGPGGPLLHDGLEVGGAGWDGPAVLGAARYVGGVVELGEGTGGSSFGAPDGERFDLPGGGTLHRVVDADPLAGRARLGATATAAAPRRFA